MKHIKPGRGPSAMGALGSVIAVVFGIFWTVSAASMGAPISFSIFGVLFVIVGIVQAVYNFKNAAGKKRYSAFDIVDGLARYKPEKLAMLHVDRRREERYFTFQDMSRYSSRAANYFKALGIKRGDRVLLILKRHYQFWFAILGLHKLGAVAPGKFADIVAFKGNPLEDIRIMKDCAFVMKEGVIYKS